MAAVEALWAPMALRFIRVAVANTTKVVRTKLASTTKTIQGSVPQAVRSGYTGRQPVHPTALLRQQKRPARWFSSATARNVEHAVRRFISSEGAAAKSSRFDRSNGTLSRRVAQSSGRAPFSSTLRPNLTGGAFPRSAGGYSLGGSARYFSHTPAAPAQVVQNVSQAMRAFFLSGQKLRYDGLGSRGERQYRAVSDLEDKAMATFQAVSHRTPGGFIDFHLSPTVTAVGPLAAAAAAMTRSLDSSFNKSGNSASLNTEGFLPGLSADFDRALKDLTAVYADIQRLSVLGDLPVVLQGSSILRVRFPGVDALTIERLCDDIGIQRGVVGQDADFDDAPGVAMALQFPCAPDSDKTVTSPGGSARSLGSHEYEDMSVLSDDSFVRDAMMDEMAENPWMDGPDEYASTAASKISRKTSSEDFEGLEGIYRFLEECDRAQGKVQ
ncbi:hypothetical protein S7711_05605 [Stachybotrys chartarum IBT 7711]|uniref:Casein kinase II beta 2 subunit n=1 Tax=Stachybotrys chartarum (strain CBS 109288 / IBT 7711) TaxID=1280523 RepID=A0A084B4Q3_STACB|nr:hypothetical protein S7711_05605 [Stachybotrys chartarum IBT 7711]KFA52494.1 hypothetical protein S40293_05648 [Stachybotrys chartarum IBT 40293]KFA75975.1 hypothetical protein S40288_05641 [Stachybotrys chartarum IBT 40288]